MFWNRNRGKRQHLVYVMYDEESQSAWQGNSNQTSKKIKTEMNKLEKRLRERLAEERDEITS